MSIWNQARPGHFYAVGVGPGAPDLLTLRAARVLQTADVIVAPRSEQSEKSLALQGIAAHLAGQEIVEHVYPMTRDAEGTRACWDAMAARIAAWCGEGKAVAQITIGDPLVYSTSVYLLEGLAARMEAARLHVVPGITAFQAAASALGECIALQEDRVAILPAGDAAAVGEALDTHEMVILYKAGKHLAALRDLLAERGLLENARLACYVEQEGRQQLWRSFGEVDPARAGYMATVLVRTGRRDWPQESHG